jgi:hypothetical protein
MPRSESGRRTFLPTCPPFAAKAVRVPATVRSIVLLNRTPFQVRVSSALEVQQGIAIGLEDISCIIELEVLESGAPKKRAPGTH